MKPQRLDILSRVKAQREDRARHALQRCLLRLEKAHEAVSAAANREQAAVATMKRKQSDLYGSILGRCLSPAAIERIHQTLMEMDRERHRFTEATQAALKLFQQAGRDAEMARRAFAQRKRDVQKWCGLEERVETQRRRAISRIEEIEIEGDLSDRWAGKSMDEAS